MTMTIQCSVNNCDTILMDIVNVVTNIPHKRGLNDADLYVKRFKNIENKLGQDKKKT